MYSRCMGYARDLEVAWYDNELWNSSFSYLSVFCREAEWVTFYPFSMSFENPVMSNTATVLHMFLLCNVHDVWQDGTTLHFHYFNTNLTKNFALFFTQMTSEYGKENSTQAHMPSKVCFPMFFSIWFTCSWYVCVFIYLFFFSSLFCVCINH